MSASGATVSASMSLEVRNAKILRYGSLAVLGGYTVALLYRVGVVRALLPRRVNDTLEVTVEKIKARTEPIGDKDRFAMARSHLVKAYTLAGSGMVAVAAGVLAFCAAPTIPIAIPIATSVVPAVLLIGIPKKLMLPAARTLCYYGTWISAGYALGPVGYAMQDSLAVVVMLSACTITGMCLPLFLTRGMISYVVSAQVLSCALSLSLVTAPKTSKSYSPFRTLKAQPSAQMILSADVNVLLTMQLLSSIGVTIVHTLPTIYRYVTWRGTNADLLNEADPLKEAFCICGGWIYVSYRMTRWCCRGFFQMILKEKPGDQNESTQDSWNVLSNRALDVNRASGLCSGVLMVLWYVRAISLLQKGDPTATLDHVRSICARLSPMSHLLGSNPRRA